MIVAVIPARGGSKRIPRKNIRPFAGKPIIAHSIGAALDSKLFDRVMVSTDDVEIAKVARAYGAEASFVRPAALSDDHIGTNAVIAHALQFLVDSGQPASIACGIYATAPFITAANLRRGFELLMQSGKSFVFSATTFPFSIQRAIRMIEGGGIAPFFPQWMDKRSQDLEITYHDAGQFYWGRAEAFIGGLSEVAAHSELLILPRHLVQDIDNIEDWRRAELMYQALRLAGEIPDAAKME